MIRKKNIEKCAEKLCEKYYPEKQQETGKKTPKRKQVVEV